MSAWLSACALASVSVHCCLKPRGSVPHRHAALHGSCASLQKPAALRCRSMLHHAAVHCRHMPCPAPRAASPLVSSRSPPRAKSTHKKNAVHCSAIRERQLAASANPEAAAAAGGEYKGMAGYVDFRAGFRREQTLVSDVGRAPRGVWLGQGCPANRRGPKGGSTRAPERPASQLPFRGTPPHAAAPTARPGGAFAREARTNAARPEAPPHEKARASARETGSPAAPHRAVTSPRARTARCAATPRLCAAASAWTTSRTCARTTRRQATAGTATRASSCTTAGTTRVAGSLTRWGRWRRGSCC